MSNDDRQQLTMDHPPIFKDIYFWLTLLLSLPVISPLLQPGYHWGSHDARHAVYFLFQFDQAIQDGIWYPRWAPDFAFGYGYPFFNIYGPLSSYMGEFFHFLGFDYVNSVKIVFGLSVILSGLSMYFWVRHVMGGPAGLIAGLVYMYIPYHIFDIYVRAALAESVGFIFIPLVILAYYQVVTQPSLRRVIWGGIAYAALMFTSNLLALLLTPILGLYVLVMLFWAKPYPQSWPQKALTLVRRAIPPAALLAFGLGLSAIFWLPAFVERQYVRVDQWLEGRYAFGSDFVEIFQLFSPRWGFGISVAGPNDDTSFQLGFVPFILVILSFWGVSYLSDRSLRVTLYFLQILVFFVIFLTLPISAWLWSIIPLATFAQFPWRLLVIIAPAMAILSGTIAVRLPTSDTRQEIVTIFPLTLLIMLGSFPYLHADLRDPYPTEGPVDLAGLFRFQQSADELTGSTLWVKEIPTWSPLADVVINGGEIETRVVTNEIWDKAGTSPLLGVNAWGDRSSIHELVWVYTADAQQFVTFYIPYFPGWTATVYEDTAPDKAALYPYGRIGSVVAQPEIQTTEAEGWIKVPMPAGTHFLRIQFEDTPIRVLGQWLSALSLLCALLGLGIDKMWFSTTGDTPQ